MARSTTKTYKAVKNLVHNELAITKEELRDILREAAMAEITKLVASRESEFNLLIDDQIRRLVNTAIRTEDGLFSGDLNTKIKGKVSTAVADLVFKELNINVEIKPPE